MDWPQALATATSDWGAAGKAVPVIFLSLVYHDLVPVFCADLGGNRAAIRCACAPLEQAVYPAMISRVAADAGGQWLPVFGMARVLQ